VKTQGASASVELDGGFQVPFPTHLRPQDGQEVMFGTRPEHLQLDAEKGLPVEVITVEPTGADTFVACRYRGTEMSAVFRDRHGFAPGSTIGLLPDWSRSHLFDAHTGLRLTA